MLYALVAELIIFYEASVCHTRKVAEATVLLSMQSGLFLYVTKCYSTVLNDALHVLVGVLPLNLRSEMDRKFTVHIRWGKSVDGTGLYPESVELW